MSVEVKHTPGPWVAREWRHHSPTTIVREVDGEVVPIADVDGAGSGYLMGPETLANARLIAAAPDMLAKLRELQQSCAECQGSGGIQVSTDVVGDDEFPVLEQCPDCADIREVIGKATGQ